MPDHILHRLATSQRLRDALDVGLGAGIPVGLSAIPMVGEPPAQAKPPYGILLPLWANLDGPPFADDRDADAEWVYQVSLAALRGDQLEAMRDRVLTTILGKRDGEYVVDLDVAGVKVTGRDLSDDLGAGSPAAGIVPSDMRFTLTCTPADTVAPPVVA